MVSGTLPETPVAPSTAPAGAAPLSDPAPTAALRETEGVQATPSPQDQLGRFLRRHRFSLNALGLLTLGVGVLGIPVVLAGPGSLAWWEWNTASWHVVSGFLTGTALVMLTLMNYKFQRESAAASARLRVAADKFQVDTVKANASLQLITRLDNANRIAIDHPEVLAKLASPPCSDPNCAHPRSISGCSFGLNVSNSAVHMLDLLLSLSEAQYQQTNLLGLPQTENARRSVNWLAGRVLDWPFGRAYWDQQVAEHHAGKSYWDDTWFREVERVRAEYLAANQ